MRLLARDWTSSSGTLSLPVRVRESDKVAELVSECILLSRQAWDASGSRLSSLRHQWFKPAMI